MTDTGSAVLEWTRATVAVIGGTGFIGSHVVERLRRRGASVRVDTRAVDRAGRYLAHLRDEIDVVEADCGDADEARRAVRGCDVVIDLAATVAGIALNRQRPAWMFASNARTIIPIFDACVAEGVRRVLYVSSACVYARDVTIPTPESEGMLDEPEPTNLGYGWAKRMGEIAGRLYAQEYGLGVSIARPYNAYGPRDDFEPATSHVIPSLIRRVEEGPDELVVWGSGSQTRSFIYVDDLAEALLLAAGRGTPGPVNLGSAEEISMGDLARLIVELSGRRTRIRFDTSKPDGQARRQPDLTRAERELGFRAPTSLRDGLARTLSYYRDAVADRAVASPAG